MPSRRRDVVGADAERHHGRPRRSRSPRNRPAASSSWGRRSGRAGRRRGQHDAPASSRPAVRDRPRQASPAPLEALGRARRADVDPPRSQGAGQSVNQDPMPSAERPEEGRGSIRGPTGAGTSARSARMRLPRRCAAASSGGKTAAADMSSTEPAWMPPISGSTSTSTTRWPSLRADQWPDGPVADRARGRRAGAAAASRARPSCTARPEDARARRTARGVSGSRARAPRAAARSRPRAQTDAPARRDRAPARRPSPTSRHRSTASGRRPRKPSGPTSTARPPNDSLQERPPRRSARPRGARTAGASAPALGAARQLPGGRQPGDAPPTDDDHPALSAAVVARWRRPAAHRPRRPDGDEGGVVVQRGGARVGDPTRRPRRPASTSRS